MALNSFGDWELKRHLGTGGFGQVVYWQNRQTNLEIATKSLKENHHMSDDEISKLKQRWKQEFAWMHNLNTEFIVRGVVLQDEDFLTYLNSWHAWRPLPVLVMEYCNGGDLRSHLQRPENLNGLHEYEVREVLNALRHAIRYLHDECRIEHRDLKPDNIVIGKSDNGKKCYKLTDFGFARNSSDNTILKSVVGTRHYFAPEVVDTAQYTNTVDYWSLGVIAFELMCGVLPFIPHQEMYQIITSIKSKNRNCIAITEDLEIPKKYHFHEKVFPENRMSAIFLKEMEEWLPLALDTNYRTRGSGVLNDENVKRESWAVVPKIFTDLDAMNESKILTIYCLNRSKYLYYKVTEEMPLLQLCEEIAKDTDLPLGHLYFIYPTGHPKSKPATVLDPIDSFVSEWQDTSNHDNPPVMLFILGVQCKYTLEDPTISTTMQHCLSLGPNDVVPQWLVDTFVRETHFLLSNEQRHLESFLTGHKEFAMTLEEEILVYSDSLTKFIEIILRVVGETVQFNRMIESAKEVYGKKEYFHTKAIFEKWKIEGEELGGYIETVDTKVRKPLKHRFDSALRRAKEQAKDALSIDEIIRSDWYGLANFRAQQQQYEQQKLRRRNANNLLKPIVEVCQEAIYICLEKRKDFSSNSRVLQLCRVVSQIHDEFLEIKTLVHNTEKYLVAFIKNLTNETLLFHVELRNAYALDKKQATPNFKMEGMDPVASTSSQQIAHLCATLDKVLKMPTVHLVQNAHECMQQLMSIDYDDEMNGLPTTIATDNP